MSHAVTLIPGDWVGPETCEVVKSLVADAGIDINWETYTQLSDESGRLHPELVKSMKRTGVVLQARWDSHRYPLLAPNAVRKALGAFAQVRYARSMPGIPSRFEDVDVAVVREITEDVYAGFEHSPAPGVYELVKLTTEKACTRVAHFAFQEARRWGRKKVTVVHKSNIMKKSDGLFLRTAQRVAHDYPEITCDEVIVDALCMRLVRNPHQFDVLLCGNLFGDIVADLVAGLAGGISMGGGTSWGDSAVIFENPHGKAPGIVGTGKANPIPMLIPTINMLHHLGEKNAADALAGALKGALEDGLKTWDLGGTAGCAEVRKAIAARL